MSGVVPVSCARLPRGSAHCRREPLANGRRVQILRREVVPLGAAGDAARRWLPHTQPTARGASLEDRISAREFSRRSVAATTRPFRQFLADLGPFGRAVAFRLAHLCRRHLNRRRTSLPEASGSLAEMVDKPFFEPLYELFLAYGKIFKLSFGPRSFVIISDPVLMKEILSSSAEQYSKGILSDILEFVMGNGLIPANGDIWLQRRRAILPSLHKSFMDQMIQTFVSCTDRGLLQIQEAVQEGRAVEMESFFSRLALDVIGRAVFNYDFDATTHDDPLIQAVYAVLREAEKRSLAAVPWWKLPLTELLIPSQRRVKASLDVINQTLDALIRSVHNTLQQEDAEDAAALSILHFLIASGEVASTQQLRDDLMTLLIAGHETTAAVLTWTFFELSKRPDIVDAMQREIDAVLGDGPISAAALLRLDLCTRVLAESMRLYPQPPVLIRRAEVPVELGKYHFGEGTDFFLSVWNLHRSPELWEEPLSFKPDRFPKNSGMPNEYTTDFAYLPFGGGRRKCIGSQFALIESLEILSAVLRRYDIALDPEAPPVKITSGATIHSAEGLFLRLSERTHTMFAEDVPTNSPFHI